MKGRIVIVLIGIGLQLLVAFSRFFPPIADWWQRQSEGPILNPIVTMLSVHFALLTSTVLLALLKDSADRDEWQIRVLDKVHGPEVNPLSDSEFYVKFENCARQAKHSVLISYFAPYPPSEVKHQDRLAYYESILKLMKAQTKVRFRRLVRDTPDNRKWVQDLASQLEGCPNVDLALLDDTPGDTENPLAVSTQVVDGEDVFLVALGGHERDGRYRDLHIRDRDAATLLVRYYDRLWSRATPVLSSGRRSRGAMLSSGIAPASQ